MRRLTQRLVIDAVALTLMTSGWLFLGVFALGDALVKPIPRSKVKGDYV